MCQVSCGYSKWLLQRDKFRYVTNLRKSQLFLSLLALPRHQHTSFICPDVSDRIALSFLKEVLNKSSLPKDRVILSKTSGQRKLVCWCWGRAKILTWPSKNPKNHNFSCFVNTNCRKFWLPSIKIREKEPFGKRESHKFTVFFFKLYAFRMMSGGWVAIVSDRISRIALFEFAWTILWLAQQHLFIYGRVWCIATRVGRGASTHFRKCSSWLIVSWDW